MKNISTTAALLLIAACSPTTNAETRLTTRAQYQFFATELDDANPAAMLNTDSPRDHSADLRIMATHNRNDLVWGIHYQLQAIRSDFLPLINSQPNQSATDLLRTIGIQDDGRRLFDLTHVMHNEDDTAYLHRLDRFYIGQNGERFSWKAGRYAVSWGNGLVYNPIDIFNPFDPVSIDKEYKTGDDLLHTQYLLDNGDDIQLIVVPRRQLLTGDVSSDVSSLAIKLHGLIGNSDYDVLVARHFDENIFGIGFASDIEGVLWRGDFTYTEGSSDDFIILVTSLNYSWTMNDMPANGFIEYYFSEIGLHYNDGYDGNELLSNQALIDRAQRGEVFTIGRRYLAPGIDIEIHPLVHLAPTLFWNLDDRSTLLQVLLSYDVLQNLIINSGVNLTAGERGSEYGEIDPSQPNGSFITGDAVFLRLSAYF